MENERIMIFLSYQLTDVKTWYENSEREYLAVIRCLTEIKCLAINKPYEILIYLDHCALKDIFSKGDSKKAQINAWLDWFSEFKLRLVHRSLKNQHIGLANGLNQMPTRLMDKPKIKDLLERLPMTITISLEIQLAPLQILQYRTDRYSKYSLQKRVVLVAQDLWDTLHDWITALAKMVTYGAGMKKYFGEWELSPKMIHIQANVWKFFLKTK